VIAACDVGLLVAGVVLGHVVQDDSPGAGGVAQRVAGGLLLGVMAGGVVAAILMVILFAIGALIESL